jgi:hypothetical protein
VADFAHDFSLLSISFFILAGILSLFDLVLSLSCLVDLWRTFEFFIVWVLLRIDLWRDKLFGSLVEYDSKSLGGALVENLNGMQTQKIIVVVKAYGFKATN